MTRFDRILSLGAALVATAVLLVIYPAHQAPPGDQPVPATAAWPHAQGATIGTVLPDGTPYQPRFFLDAQTSVGTAPDAGRRFMRLIVRSGDSSLRQLRSLPLQDMPFFGGFTVSDDVLAWAEQTRSEDLQLWTVDLRDGLPAHELTVDTGDAVLSGSPFDIQIADGQLHWAAASPQHADVTEIRSVALTGGAVDVRSLTGSWELSAWPWVVDGRGIPHGVTIVRNLSTNRDIAIASSARQTTRCGPTWCQVVSPSDAGFRVELERVDGSDRHVVSDGTAVPAIPDVAPLDRFEVVSQLGPYSSVTGTRQLLVYDIATHRTVEVSPAARSVFSSTVILWWSTDARDAPVWHSLDLRTI
jgi:hypothetical protein